MDLEKRVETLEKKMAELEAIQAQQKHINIKSLSKQIYSEISKTRDSKP